jgi:hypothetical protein
MKFPGYDSSSTHSGRRLQIACISDTMGLTDKDLDTSQKFFNGVEKDSEIAAISSSLKRP